MSNRWPGGLINKTPVTPTGPLQNGTAPGVWSMADAAYWVKQGLWPTAGNFLAVEDVFSTWLYTGNGSTQTITNGIDLAGKGGLVWFGSRSSASGASLYDTARGVYNRLRCWTTGGQDTGITNALNSFNANGFSIGSWGEINTNNETYVSWTFREAPKFFDVVTYTGTGSAQNIAHNLGAAVGYMMIKRTDASSNWATWHRALSGSQYMDMANPASAATSDSTIWNSTAPTSSVFSVGTSTNTNASGGTYVAYLWAHDPSSDGVIQCGSYTSTGNTTVTLGWEPQFIAMRRTNAAADWEVIDTMRGMSLTGLRYLEWNNSDAEAAISGTYLSPTATGFIDQFYGSGQSIIYIAIRRGPMKTPTLGTSVFSPLAVTASTGTARTTGFPVDLSIAKTRNLDYGDLVTDRLRGYVNDTSSYPPTLVTSSTAAESTSNQPASYAFNNTGYLDGQALTGGITSVYWNFRRAPSFFDEVCYTGTGSATTVAHNLGVAPELMIFKSRSNTRNWTVYAKPWWQVGAYPNFSLGTLNSSSDFIITNNALNNTQPTASVFSVGNNVDGTTTNYSGENYVAYLFASAPGVSKVGSYTGTGALQTINCAFTTGARFVLIKRTDSTGDWFVWDSARGITSGNDPYLLLNNTAAEVTGTNYVDTDTTGFKVTAAAPAGINANGGSYIFLAIA